MDPSLCASQAPHRSVIPVPEQMNPGTLLCQACFPAAPHRPELPTPAAHTLAKGTCGRPASVGRTMHPSPIRLSTDPWLLHECCRALARSSVLSPLQERAKSVPAGRVLLRAFAASSYRAHEARQGLTLLRRKMTGDERPCRAGHGRPGPSSGATPVASATDVAPSQPWHPWPAHPCAPDTPARTNILWIRDCAIEHYAKPAPPGKTIALELDEMWGAVPR